MRWFVLVAFLVTVPVSPSVAEWSPEFRVTNDPASSRTEVDGGRNVVVSDGILAVVWSDDRDGNNEIYFRERLGTIWNPAARLTNNAGSSTHPAIGQLPGEMRVVWEDNRTGHPEIWMKRKTFGSWTPDSCLTCDEFDSARPSMDHSGRHLVWEGTKDGNREIYYRERLVDGTWQPEFRISNDGLQSSHPTVASPNGVGLSPVGDPWLALVLVAWQDDRHGDWEIYSRFRYFGDWDAETRVTFDAADSRFPSATIEWDTCTDAIFPANRVAWQDDRDGNDEIYLAEGAMGEWYTSGRVASTSTPSLHPSLSTAYHVVPNIFGLTLCPLPALAWEERDGGAFSGSIRYLDFGSAAPETSISAPGADPFDPSVAVDHLFSGLDGVRAIEVLWTDERDGNLEIYEAQNITKVETTDAPETPLGVQHFSLEPAQPNPFRDATTFTLFLERESPLEVRVFDAAGRVVRDLFRGSKPAGRHSFPWDGLGEGDRPVAPGAYFVSVRSGEERQTRRVVHVR